VESPRVYRKGESFQSLSGRASAEDVMVRLAALRSTLGSQKYSEYQVRIIERALSDLLDFEGERTSGVFWLRPHVIE